MHPLTIAILVIFTTFVLNLMLALLANGLLYYIFTFYSENLLLCVLLLLISAISFELQRVSLTFLIKPIRWC